MFRAGVGGTKKWGLSPWCYVTAPKSGWASNLETDFVSLSRSQKKEKKKQKNMEAYKSAPGNILIRNYNSGEPYTQFYMLLHQLKENPTDHM